MTGMANPFAPDFGVLARCIAEREVTSLIFVPELLRGLVAAAARDNGFCASLKFVAVGGATVAPTLLQTARGLGLPVYEGYGLSECASVVALNLPGQDEIGTAGRVLPHIAVEIIDGEIVVRNPPFLGYLGEPARTPGLPFPTGDDGNVDDGGKLKVSGRRKNIIVTSQGRNISPEWLESLLLQGGDIAQAIVYGDSLPFPQALIVPVRADADIAGVVTRANSELPSYAHIAHFDIVPPFTPQNGLLTGNGRPRRAAIAKTYAYLMNPEEKDGLLRSAR